MEEGEEENDLIPIKLYRGKVKTDEDEELEGKEAKRCYDLAAKTCKQDLEILFNQLAKHILRWWD